MTLFPRTSSLAANLTIQGISLRAIVPSGPGWTPVTLDGSAEFALREGGGVYAAVDNLFDQSIVVSRTGDAITDVGPPSQFELA